MFLEQTGQELLLLSVPFIYFLGNRFLNNPKLPFASERSEDRFEKLKIVDK
jgi:hypothetical protein